MADFSKAIASFKGVKNDEDAKQIPFDCFTQIVNFNYPDDGILGLTKILMPSRVKQMDAAAVDGIFEYRFLDQSNVLQTQNIVANNGKIWKTDFTTNTALKTGLTAGKVSFAAYNDKLFIANGKNYIQIYYGSLGLVSEMGAPVAVGLATAGNVNVGAHYYAMTYVTAAGEEVLGSVSNTVTIASSAKQVTLHLPLGYDGVISRCLYRTEAGGTTLKLLAAISDNTTLTYTDNIADASLTTTIPATGAQELPKPYFLCVANQSLYATKVDKYPTQLFRTDKNIEVIDVANYVDVANYSLDNTPISGIGYDFTNVLVGTGKNIYFVKDSQNTVGTTDVIATRAGVGIKDGSTVKYLPSFGGFRGGLVFVSTLNDVRVMTGIDDIPVVNMVSNVNTQNWAQNIRGDLNIALRAYTTICAEFFENKYHLVIDNIKYVFDVRTQGWTYHNIITASYQSTPVALGILNGKLYNGQSDGMIEQEYASVQYRSEDVTATITSGFIEVSRLYKWASKLAFWFKTSNDSTVTINVTLDENTALSLSGTFTVTGPDFAISDFDYNDFLSGVSTMDYRVMNVHYPCRWLQYSLINTTGNIGFQGFEAIGSDLTNKEVA